MFSMSSDTGNRVCHCQMLAPIPAPTCRGRTQMLHAIRWHRVYPKPSTARRFGDGELPIHALQSWFLPVHLSQLSQISVSRSILVAEMPLISGNLRAGHQMERCVAAHCVCLGEHATTGFCVRSRKAHGSNRLCCCQRRGRYFGSRSVGSSAGTKVNRGLCVSIPHNDQHHRAAANDAPF